MTDQQKQNSFISDRLYPTLPPSAPAPAVLQNYDPTVFRLQKITEIQKKMEEIKETRYNLNKKYNKAIKIFNVIDNSLLVITACLGVSGIGLLSTIVAAPIALTLESVAIGSGLLNMIIKHINKTMISKAEKHEKIKTLADSKLNTINDLISKSLEDNHISDIEFNLIISELVKLNNMIDSIKYGSAGNEKINKNKIKQIYSDGILQGKKEILDMMPAALKNYR